MSATPTPDSAAELRRLHRRSAQFARNLQISLATYLRTEVTVEAQPVRREPPSEVGAGDSGQEIYAATPGLVLRLAADGVFPILEVLLGGVPDSSTLPEREITEIERHILLDFLSVVIQQFDRCWMAGLSGTIRLLSEERELKAALPAEDQLLVIPVRLKLGGFQLPLSLMLAAPGGDAASCPAVAEPLGEELAEEAQLRLLERMKGVALQFEVQAENSTVPLKDLLGLKVGQVLVLDHPLDRPMACRINQGPQITGRIVRSGEWRAFRVQPVPSE